MNSPVDAGDFRKVMGLFATGVTIVATEVDGELQCMTANAITSVSLDPLLVLVCVNKELPILEQLKLTKNFSINILREEQEALSNYFAQLWEEESPPLYEFVAWEGVPRLKGCVGSLGCVLHEVFDGGDHSIVVGRVKALHQGVEPFLPLLFYGGRYGQMIPT
ncbi:MAG: flavin reductase family protein [Anaerolineales bacterium]|jgi:flavin reductase (DIM6/NTAB) family NADH-FMN oxidoreductase RutF|nr:flavin reductase family protein [Anaerolineales bacterium]|tara:strand:+ start:23344 stop:23832 length:489 start_codon:yes stop_codon:yes gene_type:complete